MSNVASVTTPDLTAPAAVRDLAVGFVFMGWHAVPANLAVETARPLAVREERAR
jgi:hypothetical protein